MKSHEDSLIFAATAKQKRSPFHSTHIDYACPRSHDESGYQDNIDESPGHVDSSWLHGGYDGGGTTAGWSTESLSSVQ